MSRAAAHSRLVPHASSPRRTTRRGGANAAFVRRASPVVLLTLLFASCTSAPPATAPVQPGRAAAQVTSLATFGTAKRVILLSFDGLSADGLAKFGAPAFEALPVHARRVTPVEPTATSTTHAAILTGEGADRTGIVSNQYHRPGAPIGETARGLETEIDAPTLLDRARNDGKRVGTILFPFVDARSPRRTSDWGIAWSQPLSRPRILHLELADFRSEWLPPTWGAPPSRRRSFSPVMRARLDWSIPDRARQDVDLVAYDTTDDSARNYDLFYVETSTSESRIGEDRWFSIETMLDGGMARSWSKILDLDPSLQSLRLYWGAIHRNASFPESFARLVDAELGAWPGEADETLARLGLAGGDGIDPATYSEQQQRLAAWLTRVTLLAMQRMPFDLLLAYQPILDGAEHAWRIETTRQRFGTPEAMAAGERVRATAYASFDEAVRKIRGAIDVTTDALIVTGDHGLAPYDTEVRLGALLPANWRAFSNGHVSHLYRFGEGDDVEKVAALLAELKSPDGEPVLERIVRRTATSHRNSGDLVVYAWPRFVLTNTSGDLFSRAASSGQHGGLTTHPEFDTTLAAAGKAAGVQRLERIHQTEIAPWVVTLLGLKR